MLRLGVVAAVAAGPMSVAERVLAANQPARLARKTFTPLVGRTFTVATPSASYSAVLRSVGDLPYCPPGDQYRFRLLFEISSGGPEQGTYTFRQRTLMQQLFVVPVGGGRQHYEAVVAS